MASDMSLNKLPFGSEVQAKKSKFYHILPLRFCRSKVWTPGMKWSHPEYLPMFLSRMLQQGTVCFEDNKNYARFWLLNYSNKMQHSVIETGSAGKLISVLDLKALQEVFQREKELVLVLSAEENDLESLLSGLY